MSSDREAVFTGRWSVPPIGLVTIVATRHGVRRILLGRAASVDETLSGSRRLVARIVAALRVTLAGGKPSTAIRLDLDPLPPLTRVVLDFTRTIPFGATMTYGEVARALGRPGAARAVGQALGRNPVPILIPCHRVVAAGGLGGFSCGVAIKRRLLAWEGNR